MDSNRTEPSILLPTLIVALLALLVFTSSLSFFPFPGESAAMLVRYGGIDPLPTAYHPLYALVAQWFATLPVGTLAFRIGLISTLSGAACGALLFVMVARLRIRQAHPDEAPDLPLVAGLPAAAYLVVAAPFWASANRTHPVLFHLSLLLAALMLLQRYGRKGGLLSLTGAAFLLGLLLLEWAGTLLVLPCAIIAVVLYLHGKNQLFTGHFLLPLAAFAIGVGTFVALFYARLAWAIADPVDPPALHLGSALLTLFGEHLYVLEREFSGMDGVLIALGSIAPWLVAMVCAGQEGEPDSFAGAVILHMVLTVLCLILLFLGAVSPTMMNDLHSLAAVPPIIASAAVFGYVVGYWYVLVDRRYGENEPVMLRILMGFAVGIILVVTTAVAVNLPRTSTRVAEATHRWATTLLEAIPPNAVIIAPANEQNILTVIATEQNHPITPINLTRAGDPEYRHFISRTLAPPELHDLAEYGLPHFLAAWGFHPDYPTGRVFTTEALPRWRTDQRPVLSGYLSMSDPDAAWSPELIEQHEGYWQHVIPALEPYRTALGFPGRFCRSLLDKASRTANDLALLAREKEAYNDAYIALRAARSIRGDNLHAAANQFLLLMQTGQLEEASSTWDSIRALVTSDPLPAERSGDGVLLGADRLRTFASLRRRTEDNLPDSDVFRDALAAYVVEEIPTSDSLRRALRQAHSDEPDGWLLAGLLAADRNDTNSFAECTAGLSELKADPTPLLVAVARQAIERNDVPWAQQLMLNAVTRQPADIDILETLATVDSLISPSDDPPTYIHRLLSLDPNSAVAHYALGARHLVEGKREPALEEFLAASPKNGAYPRATLLAALLSDDAEDSISNEAADLALRGLHADLDDAHFWNASKDIYLQMDLAGAAAYAAGRAQLASSETPASQALARLIETARTPAPISVAVTPSPSPGGPNTAEENPDLRTLLNQVVSQDQGPPSSEPPPSGASTSSSDTPPSLDDEAAPVPLLW